METVDFELDLTDITTDLSIEVDNITPMIKEVEVIVPEYIEVDTKMAGFVQGKPFEVVASDFGELTEVRESMFAHSSIEKVTIPSTIKTIGKSAFDVCKNLKTAILKDGITSIGQYAFRQAGIESIEIPDSVTSMGTYMFSTCPSLESAKVPNVPTNTFYNCTSLTSITIGNGATDIGTGAFYNCKKLQSVTIPDSVSVESIGNDAFYYCEKLKSITLPNSLTSIGKQAFSFCYGLKSLTIPSGVTDIGGSNALNIGSSSGKGTIIMLPTTPPTIQTTTFYKSLLEKIIVPKGCLSAYQTATNWTSFASLIVEAEE